MKRLSLILILLLCAGIGNAGGEVMRVGYLFNHCKDGKLDPVFDEYYGAVLGSAMGVKIEWVGPLPFARVLSYLKSGDLHMFYAMSKNEERETYILYSDTPSWYDKPPLIVKRDSPITRIDNAGDLHGYRIGYCLKMIKPLFFDDPKITVEYTSGDQWGLFNLKKLRAGRLDMAFFPSVSLYEGFEKELPDDIKREFRIVYPSREMLGKYMGKHYEGFSRLNAGHFFERYEKAIKKVGIFQDYYRKHKE